LSEPQSRGRVEKGGVITRNSRKRLERREDPKQGDGCRQQQLVVIGDRERKIKKNGACQPGV